MNEYRVILNSKPKDMTPAELVAMALARKLDREILESLKKESDE